jgi:hypothetical protein
MIKLGMLLAGRMTAAGADYRSNFRHRTAIGRAVAIRQN